VHSTPKNQNAGNGSWRGEIIIDLGGDDIFEKLLIVSLLVPSFRLVWNFFPPQLEAGLKTACSLCLWRWGQIFMETLFSCQTSAEAETWGNTWSDLIAGLAIVRTAIPSLHPRDVFPRHTANRRGSPSHSKSKNLRIQTKIFIFHKTSITDSPADHLPDDICDGFFETLFDSNESRSVPRRLNRRRHLLVINAIQFKSLCF
jgi:hypothetical protein